MKIEPWTGVRSYFARNHMRAMSVGDQVLFHHSSVDPPGVAGLAKVVRVAVVDETQFDPDSKYYDPKATRAQPVWDCVEVEYVETFPHFVAIGRLREDPALADMMVLRRGMRLSVQPVTDREYARIVELGHTEPPAEPVKPPREPRAVAPRKKGKARTKAKKKVKAHAQGKQLTTKRRVKR